MIEHIRIKPDKCIACRRCEVACIASHHNLAFKEAMKHRDALASRVHVIKTAEVKTSVRCHQCDPAPCANICPTHALDQDSEGRITLKSQLCIACKMCIAACPYGTIHLDTMGRAELTGQATDAPAEACAYPRREVAVRCDVCYAWRMENGKKITACMEVCPVRALYMVEPDGEVVEAPPIEKKKPKKVEEG